MIPLWQVLNHCPLPVLRAYDLPRLNPPSENKTTLCYCDRQGENSADTICAEREEACGMERECRRFVGNVVFSFQLTTEFPAVLYNHTLALQYLFMRKGLFGRTSLLEGRG
jgi:hypothetical protein